jgi:hypothetical protein
VIIKTLYTCCEQVVRRGKDYETNALPVVVKYDVTINRLIVKAQL